MKSTAENKLNEINKTMTIYVDPNDPTQSVMYCESISLYVYVIFMAIVSLLIGISYL
jgi:hypothetical protein